MWYYKDCNYFYHHGILGMRWGKRNGPPYPLSDKMHSVSERNAGWEKSLNRFGNLLLTEEQKSLVDIGKKIINDDFLERTNKNIPKEENGVQLSKEEYGNFFRAAHSNIKIQKERPKYTTVTTYEYTYIAELRDDETYHPIKRVSNTDNTTEYIRRFNEISNNKIEKVKEYIFEDEDDK